MSDRSRATRAPVVGLTGGIACGKSEVARILEREGAAVRDADDIAHELMRSGQVLFDPVVERFGREIVGPDGEIDRARLGRRVFADADARRALERIVHPEVIRVLRAWVDRVAGEGRAAVAVVPLLYEVGLTAPWDAVLCVVASEATVMDRLRRRGLGEEEARRRVAAQRPVEEKAARADYIVRNDGTMEQLENETKKTWRNILKKERAHHAGQQR